MIAQTFIPKTANMLSKPTIPTSSTVFVSALFTCYFRFLQFLPNLKCFKTFQKKKVLPTDRPYFFPAREPETQLFFFLPKSTFGRRSTAQPLCRRVLFSANRTARPLSPLSSSVAVRLFAMHV